MRRGRNHVDGQVSWLLRLVASSPARLLFGVLIIAAVTVTLARHLTVETALVPTPVADQMDAPPLAPNGDRLMVVLQTDHVTPELISAIERITARTTGIAGVIEVHSVTNTLVLTKADEFTPIATPAFGTQSRLPVERTLTERTLLAASSRLGSADLISSDGKTMSIIAVLTPAASTEARSSAASDFKQVVDTEVAAAGLPATVHLAGGAVTTMAVADGMRTDLSTLVTLAVVFPALLALLVLRRRVPVAALLAGSGAALLLAAVVVANTSGVDSNPVAADHPIAIGNQIVDDNLRGTVPIEIEFAGSAGDFRKPEVLARVDALSNWLRDEYSVNPTGLSSTVRDEAGIITGVDSVPPNPADIDALIVKTHDFDNGVLLHQVVNDDFSRTRLIAYRPDRGSGSVEAMARRFDQISVVLLQNTDVAARLTAREPAIEQTPTTMADILGLLGALTVVLGGLLGLLGAWARHRAAVIEGYAAPIDTEGDDDGSSLFSRARHALHEIEQQVRDYDDYDHRPGAGEEHLDFDDDGSDLDETDRQEILEADAEPRDQGPFPSSGAAAGPGSSGADRFGPARSPRV